jgi:glutaredoxin 3
MKPVRMYTTASCPYCTSARQLLAERGVLEIEEIRIDLDPEARVTMQKETSQRTVPQIFIGDLHIGGCDDLYALDRAGSLTPLLHNHLTTVRKT